jgi:hypothetical protein
MSNNSYDNLYQDVKTFLKNSSSGKLSISSISNMTRYAMEVVQIGKNWSSMRGSEKKELVYNVITNVVEDILNDEQIGKNIDPETKEILLSTLQFIPTLIDTSVDFAKVYLNMKNKNKNKNNNKKCRFFCCC